MHCKSLWIKVFAKCNDAENSALHHINILHFKTYYNRKWLYIFYNISQYYCFYHIFGQINNVLLIL